MRNKLRFVAFFLSLIPLVSCGKKTEEQVIIEHEDEVVESTTEEATENSDEAVEEQKEGNIFSMMPKKYTFASGAGAWATGIELSEDGSFTGNHHDSDMGSTGDGYPNGTIYTCDFSGKFTDPEPTDKPNIYSMKLGELKVKDEEKLGTQEIIDEVLYVYSSPYGFDDADEFLIYTPGASLAEIPEECMLWTSLNAEVSDKVPDGYYIIYNVGGQEAFCALSDDSVWKGTYRYESGEAYAEFSPHLAGSYLVFFPKDKSPASFSVKIPWDGKNNEPMVCGSYWGDEEDIQVKVTVKQEKEADSEKLKYVITMEHLSDPQYDFSAWGGNEPGKFSAEFVEEKEEY